MADPWPWPGGRGVGTLDHIIYIYTYVYMYTSYTLYKLYNLITVFHVLFIQWLMTNLILWNIDDYCGMSQDRSGQHGHCDTNQPCLHHVQHLQTSKEPKLDWCWTWESAPVQLVRRVSMSHWTMFYRMFADFLRVPLRSTFSFTILNARTPSHSLQYSDQPPTISWSNLRRFEASTYLIIP